MAKLKLREAASYADVQVVGLPRALMYYRYGALWTAFFEALGREVVLSRPTDRAVAERGSALANDECCLASKIYLGHVDELRGRCDGVFVPSLANVGQHRSFCTKFQALPDLVSNTFEEGELRVVSCLVNQKKRPAMDESFEALALQFGASPKEAKHAWKEASKAQERVERDAAAAQTQALEDIEAARRAAEAPVPADAAAGKAPEPPLAILLAAHPYVARDPYLGGVIVDLLQQMGATVLFSDETDRRRAFKASEDFSETMPWIVNREIVGSIMMLGPQVDGIVLVSAFPCGPDSMTDDAIVRCMQGKPILNLTVDAQSGTAGLETRIESFVDILRYQQKGGYVHVA